MSNVNTAASAATAAATTIAVRKPAIDGNSEPANDTVIPASTAPITALEIDVPNDRARALMPFAAAVSESGTAALMSAGIEA
jgi:hypothetical protein